MHTRKIHFISGSVIAFFVAAHLLNHMVSIAGAEKHIAVMNKFRLVYRNFFVETVLVLAVLVQVVSGIRLFLASKIMAVSTFDKIQRWSGFYLTLFFAIHLGAVFAGRMVLHLDTNFYFGVAGLNSFPLNLFFVPYYALAIVAFFAHIASIHRKKMKQPILSLTVQGQSIFIIILGIVFAITILYGLTNHFSGVVVPVEYKVLTGK